MRTVHGYEGDDDSDSEAERRLKQVPAFEKKRHSSANPSSRRRLVFSLAERAAAFSSEKRLCANEGSMSLRYNTW